MKNFLKMTLATLVGLVLFGVLTMIIGTSLLGSMMMMSDAPTSVDKGTVFELSLDGTLIERNEANEMAFLMSKFQNSGATIGLDEVLTAIDRAKNNANIVGIYLNIGSLSASPASLCEIRQALADFKATGKWIVAYADDYGNGTYALATVADKLALNTHGTMGLTGLSFETMFFHKALEKFGVEMQVFKVGTFKSAVEPYICDEMSDANRLQMNELSTSLWNSLRNDMSQGRNLPNEVFDDFANRGDFFADADVAYNHHLVDTLVYREEMKSIIESLAGKNYASADLKTMKNLPDETKYSAQKIAVVYATGEIDGNGNDAMDSEKIAETLTDLADDDAVKAVVLRVNSPGGSAYGSEQMWHATQLVKAKKPFIVSMGDYAASGGYYMSCGADTIVAQATTLTGSIGIFGVLPNIKKATDYVGVSSDGVKTHEYADFGSMFRPVTEGERRLFQNSVERGYKLFVKRCADGRHTTPEAIEKIAEGRVWSGEDALKIGLVDVLGNLDDAIRIAAEKANLTEYNIKNYPTKRDWMACLMDDLEMNIVQHQLGDGYRYWQMLQSAKTRQGVLAIMPFYIEIK